MSLDDVVDLSIDVETVNVAAENFGTPIIVGYHTAWLSDLVREYAKPSEMLSDGFTASHYLYKAAQAVKAQNPSPKTFKIGRRTTALTQIVNFTPTTTVEGKKYLMNIAGHEITYTVGSGSSVKAIVEAIQPLIDALSEVTCTEDDTKLVVTSATAGTPFSFDPGPYMTVSEETSDTTTDDAIAAILVEDSDWYGLVVADSHSKATGLLVAGAIESERKMAVVQSADSACYDSGSSTDILASLESASYARTVPIFHAKTGGTEFAAAAWLGKSIAKTPGKVSWAHKALAGITVDDFLTQAQQTAIANKNGNYYITLGAQGDTFPGKTSAGEYADITHFVDYLYSRIRLVTVALMQTPDKIPYTDAGVDIIRSGILGVLQQNVGKNGAPAGLAEEPAPTVTAPLVASVSAEFRTARHLPDVEFTAQLQGAIHTVSIHGTIAV